MPIDAMARGLAASSRALRVTFATLPAATAYTGFARVSDIGVAGSFWFSDGATWTLVNGRALLFRSNLAAAAVTGTTGETTTDTIVIPGGIMGPNGGLEIMTRWTLTANTNNKNLRYRLNGTALQDPTVAGSFATAHVSARINNRNSQSSQIAANGGLNYTAASNAWRTSTVDTSADSTLTITAQLAVGTDSATRESYEIWLVR